MAEPRALLFDVFGTCVDWRSGVIRKGEALGRRRHAGLSWDAVLGAEIARAYKPQPEVYEASVRALGLEPPQAMMVAAHPGDLAAAAACGLRTAYVHRPGEYGPGGSAEPPPDGAVDLVAGDLLDLARLLRA